MGLTRVHWLSTLQQQLAASVGFLAVLDRDLTEQAIALRGVDPREAFRVVPRFRKLSVHFDDQGVAVLLCDLVDSEASAAPATIGWVCEKHPGEKILPSDPSPHLVGGAQGAQACRVRAFWIDLPANLGASEGSER